MIWMQGLIPTLLQQIASSWSTPLPNLPLSKGRVPIGRVG